MATLEMTPDVLEIVAARFKGLAEPARLHLLACLRDGEMTVSDLVQATGLGQANVSKHLGILHGLGFVARRREGAWAFYRLADDDVFALCDIRGGRLEREHRERGRLLS